MLLEAQRQLLNFESVREELLTSSGIKADYDLIWKPSDNKVLGMLPKDQYVISHTEAVQRLEEVLKREGLDTGTSIAKFNYFVMVLVCLFTTVYRMSLRWKSM